MRLVLLFAVLTSTRGSAPNYLNDEARRELVVKHQKKAGVLDVGSFGMSASAAAIITEENCDAKKAAKACAGLEGCRWQNRHIFDVIFTFWKWHRPTGECIDVGRADSRVKQAKDKDAKEEAQKLKAAEEEQERKNAQALKDKLYKAAQEAEAHAKSVLEKKKVEEMAAAAKEAEKKEAEEIALAKKLAEEAEAKKLAKEAAAKEAAAKKLAAEAEAKKLAEAEAKEAAAKKRAEKDAAKKLAEETAASNVAPKVSRKYCAHRCEAKRVRKDFALLTDAERSLYIEAVNLAYQQGIWTKFVVIHQDEINDPFAHQTSGFLPWHRLFLYELENALRCLGDKFKCLTLPYWDWAEWQYFCNENVGGCSGYDDMPSNMKEHLGAHHPRGAAGVKNILQVFGGPGKRKPGCPAPDGTWAASCYCTYGSAGTAKPFTGKNPKCKEGQIDKVGCVEGPFQSFRDWDDNCLSRGTDWTFKVRKAGDTINNKPLTTNMQLLKVIMEADHYSAVNGKSGFRALVQNTPHNNQHNFLGGHMRSMRSPFDPIFYSHHGRIDKTWTNWQDCHNYEDLKGDKLSGVQYRGNSPDAGIDVDMPYWMAEPFRAGEHCSEAGIKTPNACTTCMGKNFQKQLGSTWCQKKWDPACPNFCMRKPCTHVCGATGGNFEQAAITATTFKRKDNKPYEYVWNKDGLGYKARDHLLHPKFYPMGGYSYQIDDFDLQIGAKSCDMHFETTELDARFRAGRTADGMTAQVLGFNTLVEEAKKKGKTGKAAYAYAATADSKDQCGKMNKSPACDTSQGAPSCDFECTGNPDTETRMECTFDHVFGTGNGNSEGANREALVKLELRSWCKDTHLTHADYAKKAAATPSLRSGDRV